MLIALLFACSAETESAVSLDPINDGEASAAAAKVLCDAATLGGMDCQPGAGVAVLGDHTVETTVTVTGFVPLEGRTLGVGAQAQQLPGEVQLTATIALTVDNVPLASQDFTHAASDVDLEVARAAVLDEVLQQWMVGTGLAAIDALNGDGAPSLGALGMEVTPAEVNGATVYAAYPMLSGVGLDPSTGSKMGPNVGTMAKALGPYLADAEPGLVLVHVTAELGGPGGPGACGLLPSAIPMNGGEVSMVRLDGEVVVGVDGTPQDICLLSQETSWPLPGKGNTVTWEQYFVVEVASPVTDEG